MSDRFYIGIDVGTGSVRAGVFDAEGTRAGMGVCDIQTFRPAEDLVEQSSEDIWRAAGEAARDALRDAGVAGDAVRGLGFDATCSLVALGARDEPVTVSPTGDDAHNVIVGTDHRAVDQARRINAGHHAVLGYVGGVISPEMETPKVLWLKEMLPGAYARATRLLDLADFMSYRATGSDTRSLCTTACKWTYLGHEGDGGAWDEVYFRAIGLGDLADDGFSKIGARVRPMGERAGALTAQAAADLGLAPGTPVAVSGIDAHAGGLGLLGAPLDGIAPTEAALEERLALIGGTSTCHMAVSREPRFVPGVRGPYFAAMIPGMWLTEGGQSATGALIDHVIHSHARGSELAASARAEGTTVYALLNRRLDALAEAARDEGQARFAAALCRDLHVLPDHHGNRSPRADPTLRGMISGLGLSDSMDALALLYLATIQAIALGTRHILEAMAGSGHRVRVLMASGGDAKNPVFIREHADATGCRVAMPREPEAVLLGAAILAAVASGDQPSLLAAMSAMDKVDRVVAPAGDDVKAFLDAKYRVFLRLHDDQIAYRHEMER